MNVKKRISLSIFFPCYNDRYTIGTLIRKARKIAASITEDFEIIVIDDASTDGSREYLNKLTRTIKELRLVFHQFNQGYGAVLKSGLSRATKDMIFYTDGDGQYDVSELPSLLALMKRDITFVNGIKAIRSDPWYRVIIGNLYNFVSRWLFWLPVFDVDCDYRLMKRAIAKRINLTCTSGAVCIELVKQAQLAGAVFKEVTVNHYERKFGRSQFFNVNHLFKTGIEYIRLWINIILIPALANRHG